MIKFLLVAAVLLYLGLLTAGAISGRIRVRNGCCGPADPAKDLRMRGANATPASPHPKQ